MLRSYIIIIVNYQCSIVTFASQDVLVTVVLIFKILFKISLTFDIYKLANVCAHTEVIS